MSRDEIHIFMTFIRLSLHLVSKNGSTYFSSPDLTLLFMRTCPCQSFRISERGLRGDESCVESVKLIVKPLLEDDMHSRFRSVSQQMNGS